MESWERCPEPKTAAWNISEALQIIQLIFTQKKEDEEMEAKFILDLTVSKYVSFIIQKIKEKAMNIY